MMVLEKSEDGKEEAKFKKFSRRLTLDCCQVGAYGGV